MTNQPNNRRSGRSQETPQRVQQAAEQLQNTSSHGNFRGYVPQQTGSQPAMGGTGRQQMNGIRPNTMNRMPMNQTGLMQPVYPPAQQGGGQRGFGTPSAQTKSRKKSKTVWIVIGILFILAAIGAGTYYGIQMSKDAEARKVISDKVAPYDALYCPGVYVDGISLGGMTPEQAMNSVQSQIKQNHGAWKVQLMYEGNIVADINAELLNMSLDQNDLNHLMNEAWMQGHTGSYEERYAQMEALEKEPYQAYTGRPSGDTSKIDALLASLKAQIDQPAQDAAIVAFDVTRAYPFVFTNEVAGQTLNTEPLKEQLYQMVSTMTSGTVELVPEPVLPQVTVADLEKHYALRASATTPIDKHSTDERNNNIRRCFQLISGTVVQPGKNFSFNKTVGPRTLENGFFPAIEYINDEHVEGIGGGACQASTTVYQAAVCAGLEIVSRRPHSDSVSYAEYGKDATVYMGGKQIDLVFKNNTEEPIYITAEVLTDPSNKQRFMTKVCIYGTDMGNVRYTLETETVETLPSIMEPVYVTDKESAASARDGCVVDSYRMTYTDGVLTNREFLFKDTYNPKPEKIYDPYR